VAFKFLRSSFLHTLLGLALAMPMVADAAASKSKRAKPEARGSKITVLHGQRVVMGKAKKSAAPVLRAKKAEPKSVVASRKKGGALSVRQMLSAKRSAIAHRSLLTARANASRHRVRVAHVPVQRSSFGTLSGLQSSDDPLELKSSVALVVDQDSNEVLFGKNLSAVLPIASLTKLMTALVVSEAKQPLHDMLTISDEDIDTEKGSRSRLDIGTQLTREEMLHLALMSSENRASHALARHYPGGVFAFVQTMNKRARELGMSRTHYVDPTGLSSDNQSSARDLATLVKAAHAHQIIRELSTSPEHHVFVGERYLQFRNTNGLVRNSDWDIGLQKTGYISEAGRCLVMQARLAGRQLIMVFLDSNSRYARIGDAERVRKWVEDTQASPAPQDNDAAGFFTGGPRFSAN
jgi:serine-type D-Ala-D-Ala endopeptidase (penicillin-binding protein 7)